MINMKPYGKVPFFYPFKNPRPTSPPPRASTALPSPRASTAVPSPRGSTALPSPRGSPRVAAPGRRRRPPLRCCRRAPAPCQQWAAQAWAARKLDLAGSAPSRRCPGRRALAPPSPASGTSNRLARGPRRRQDPGAEAEAAYMPYGLPHENTIRLSVSGFICSTVSKQLVAFTTYFCFSRRGLLLFYVAPSPSRCKVLYDLLLFPLSPVSPTRSCS